MVDRRIVQHAGGVRTHGLSTFSQDPVRHGALMMHDDGLEWLEQLTTERFGLPQKHFFIDQKPFASVRQVIAAAFD